MAIARISSRRLLLDVVTSFPEWRFAAAVCDTVLNDPFRDSAFPAMVMMYPAVRTPNVDRLVA